MELSIPPCVRNYVTTIISGYLIFVLMYFLYILLKLIIYILIENLEFCPTGLLWSTSVFRPTTLIVCDSRGASLLPHLHDHGIRLKVYRGARIMFVAHRASDLIDSLAPVTVLIAAGINDLTYKDKGTKTTNVRFMDAFDLANYVIRQILIARSMLIRQHPNVRLAFGGINGIQLNKYNGLDGYSESQGIIDEAIMQINAYIRLLNQVARVYPPRLTFKVHTWYKGRNNNYHLLRDGLHFGHIVTRYWLRSIKRFHRVNTLGHVPSWINDGRSAAITHSTGIEVCAITEHS